MGSMNDQLSIFDMPRIEIIEETAIGRGQGYSSPLAQMRAKKTVTMVIGNMSFQVKAETAERLSNWLIGQFNQGGTFDDAMRQLVNRLT
jgi:hypothetical protein